MPNYFRTGPLPGVDPLNNPRPAGTLPGQNPYTGAAWQLGEQNPAWQAALNYTPPPEQNWQTAPWRQLDGYGTSLERSVALDPRMNAWYQKARGSRPGAPPIGFDAGMSTLSPADQGKLLNKEATRLHNQAFLGAHNSGQTPVQQGPGLFRDYGVPGLGSGFFQNQAMQNRNQYAQTVPGAQGPQRVESSAVQPQNPFAGGGGLLSAAQGAVGSAFGGSQGSVPGGLQANALRSGMGGGSPQGGGRIEGQAVQAPQPPAAAGKNPLGTGLKDYTSLQHMTEFGQGKNPFNKAETMAAMYGAGDASTGTQNMWEMGGMGEMSNAWERMYKEIETGGLNHRKKAKTGKSEFRAVKDPTFGLPKEFIPPDARQWLTQNYGMDFSGTPFQDPRNIQNLSNFANQYNQQRLAGNIQNAPGQAIQAAGSAAFAPGAQNANFQTGNWMQNAPAPNAQLPAPMAPQGGGSGGSAGGGPAWPNGGQAPGQPPATGGPMPPVQGGGGGPVPGGGSQPNYGDLLARLLNRNPYPMGMPQNFPSPAGYWGGAPQMPSFWGGGYRPGSGGGGPLPSGGGGMPMGLFGSFPGASGGMSPGGWGPGNLRFLM